MKTIVRNSTAVIVVAVLLVSAFSSCKKGGLNIFTIDDDKNFGAQMETEIANNPAEYPLVSESAYPNAYLYLNTLRDRILASGKLDHAADFSWKLHIIKNDTIQNAFCTPGGYIYVYTGLIKYLDNASSLAGVMGHEMAHADRRHSTQQLTTQYGISLLFDVVAGVTSQQQLADIAANLSLLAFSREHEKDADEHSVIYLCPTTYRADGAADFFEKIIASGAPQPPAFLSTHPNPDNRVTNIHTKKTELGCTGNPSASVESTEYANFKANLP